VLLKIFSKHIRMLYIVQQYKALIMGLLKNELEGMGA